MIRIWKGIEKETILDEPDFVTLFVCSDIPLSASKIIPFLEDNPDVKSLYLGAGRKPFYGVASAKDWDTVVLFCKQQNIRIIMEVSPIMLQAFIHLYKSDIVTFIIAYYDIPKNISKLYFKTDDFAITKLFTLKREVDVTSLVKDMYPDDVLIYTEED